MTSNEWYWLGTKLKTSENYRTPHFRNSQILTLGAGGRTEVFSWASWNFRRVNSSWLRIDGIWDGWKGTWPHFRAGISPFNRTSICPWPIFETVSYTQTARVKLIVEWEFFPCKSQVKRRWCTVCGVFFPPPVASFFFGVAKGFKRQRRFDSVWHAFWRPVLLFQALVFHAGRTIKK